MPPNTESKADKRQAPTRDSAVPHGTAGGSAPFGGICKWIALATLVFLLLTMAFTCVWKIRYQANDLHLNYSCGVLWYRRELSGAGGPQSRVAPRFWLDEGTGFNIYILSEMPAAPEWPDGRRFVLCLPMWIFVLPTAAATAVLWWVCPPPFRRSRVRTFSKWALTVLSCCCVPYWIAMVAAASLLGRSSHRIPAAFAASAILMGPAVAAIILWRRDRQSIRVGFCRFCGYNLSGAPHKVCPECGGPIPRDSKLHEPIAKAEPGESAK